MPKLIRVPKKSLKGVGAKKNLNPTRSTEPARFFPAKHTYLSLDTPRVISAARMALFDPQVGSSIMESISIMMEVA
jgi:hypothetical protein